MAGSSVLLPGGPFLGGGEGGSYFIRIYRSAGGGGGTAGPEREKGSRVRREEEEEQSLSSVSSTADRGSSLSAGHCRGASQGKTERHAQEHRILLGYGGGEEEEEENGEGLGAMHNVTYPTSVP